MVLREGINHEHSRAIISTYKKTVQMTGKTASIATASVCLFCVTMLLTSCLGVLETREQGRQGYLLCL